MLYVEKKDMCYMLVYTCHRFPVDGILLMKVYISHMSYFTLCKSHCTLFCCFSLLAKTPPARQYKDSNSTLVKYTTVMITIELDSHELKYNSSTIMREQQEIQRNYH